MSPIVLVRAAVFSSIKSVWQLQKLVGILLSAMQLPARASRIGSAVPPICLYLLFCQHTDDPIY
jgi:hypothetical protein